MPGSLKYYSELFHGNHVFVLGFQIHSLELLESLNNISKISSADKNSTVDQIKMFLVENLQVTLAMVFQRKEGRSWKSMLEYMMKMTIMVMSKEKQRNPRKKILSKNVFSILRKERPKKLVVLLQAR